MGILRVVFLSSLLVLFTQSSATTVVDFCVADLQYPEGPAGYSCKNPANLTVDDFVFSGLRVAGDTSASVFNVAATFAVDITFPALNGLGLSMTRLDIGVGGVVPIHTHRVSELILVIEGEIIAGFIDSNGVPYYKELYPGDIMIFPQSLLHFQVNVGHKPALAFVSLNSPNPGFQFTALSMFGNDLPTEIIEKISLLDSTEVKRMKEIFGGTS
ncbi:auxin-binding protein ABP19a-like [Silene latifolia]|uniref:auxin-binding protein ABP19a-like n=1 Tax=Silene latifolia TaxID=37657 RepID=UPI003D78A380